MVGAVRSEAVESGYKFGRSLNKQFEVDSFLLVIQHLQRSRSSPRNLSHPR